jgi:hypothetical protein
MYCAGCGEDMGGGKGSNREPESCGRAECNREVRDIYREIADDARERAEMDDYERYR